MELFKLENNEAFLISQKALIIENDKLLILKNQEKNVTWELPGGLLEFGENLEKGFEREIQEEVGAKIKSKKLFLAVDTFDDNFYFQSGESRKVQTIALCYICEKEAGEIRLSKEHEAFMWCSKEELQGLSFGPKTALLIQGCIKAGIIK